MVMSLRYPLYSRRVIQQLLGTRKLKVVEVQSLAREPKRNIDTKVVTRPSASNCGCTPQHGFTVSVEHRGNTGSQLTVDMTNDLTIHTLNTNGITIMRIPRFADEP